MSEKLVWTDLKHEVSSEVHQSFQATWLQMVLVLGGLGAFVMWLTYPLLTRSGFPWGADVHAHLTWVWYTAKALRATGRLPSWFPGWNSGIAIFQYYPTTVTRYTMLPLQLVANDINVTYRLFVIGCLLLIVTVTFLVMRRWASPGWAALAVGVYLAAPYNLRSLFLIGALPRTMGLVLMPLMLASTLRVLEWDSRRSFLGLSVVTLVAVLNHYQQTVIVVLTLGVICLMHLDRTRTSRLRIVLALSSMVLGVGLAAWWLVPALTNADYANVPTAVQLSELLPVRSVSWHELLNPFHRDTTRYLGLSVAGLATLATVFHPTRFKLSLYLAALINFTLALGSNNPLYRHSPLANTIQPERFLQIAALLLAMLVIGLGRIAASRRFKPWVRSVLFGLVLGLVVWDLAPHWSLPRVGQYPPIQTAMASLPPSDGLARLDVWIVDGGEPGVGIWFYVPLLYYDYPLATGKVPALSPHNNTFFYERYALRNGYPQFVLRNMATYNVRATVISGRESALIESLKAAGFREQGRSEGKVVLASPAPSTPVMTLRSNGIVIGRGNYMATIAFPWLSYGTSGHVDDYDPAYLDLFDLIYLYDFRYDNLARLEQQIKDWAAAGKTVVLDLTGMTSDYPLLGVQAKNIVVPRNPTFMAGSAADFPLDEIAERPFEDGEYPWRGVTYYGLDGTLVEVQDDTGKTWPAFGFKELPEGRVYFVGLNWITHIVFTHDQAAADLMDNFFQRAGPYRKLVQPGFPVEIIRPPADEWSFKYSSDEDMPVVASETWSPHWQATLDGEPLQVYNHENLIMLFLPAGDHLVEFRYGSTPIQWVGWGITLVFAALLVITLIVYPRLENWYASVEDWVFRLVWQSSAADRGEA